MTRIADDENGNTLSEASPGHTVTDTWDAEDRLVQVLADGRREEFA